MFTDSIKNSKSRYRILMQSRPNVFVHRGGDTVVLERLSDGLSKRGHEVTIDLQGAVDPESFDLVHLFNFATTEITKQYARRACSAGVPYVVTTLYEDVPSFHRQSHLVAGKLIEYVARGQQPQSFKFSYQQFDGLQPISRFPADEIARCAAALMPNGAGEAAALGRDFPDTQRIISVPLGSEVGAMCGPELFEQVYGERDFVLCVGRFESRKNQLMLLKALEDSPLTVVLAGGGFSYQPEYDAAIRAFKRRGKTIILGMIDPQMLSSAYAACRMHVLPSWYELPGLVSLEAAARDKNVVVTRTGTTADYLDDKAFYCLPWDSDSILSAVTAAYYGPVREGLADLARSYTWASAVEKTEDVYREVVVNDKVVSVVETQGVTPKNKSVATQESIAAPRSDQPVTNGDYSMNSKSNHFNELVERGEIAAKNSEFALAESYLVEAERIDPQSTRVLKARGAILLAQMKSGEAMGFFDRALVLEPNEPKLLAGRGMCDLLQSRPDKALQFFERALDNEPGYLVALYQLLECVYGMGQYATALRALNRYLQLKPDDVEIRFCLAGCLFKDGQIEAAKRELDVIERSNPDHQGARELRQVMSSGETREASDNQEVAQMIGRIEDLKRSGEFSLAIDELSKLLTQGELEHPYREIAACLEAEFTVLSGDLQLAGRKYDRILELNPSCARALCGKGALAAEAQQWSEAREYFKQAISFDSECDVAYAGMGICALTDNDMERAFGFFQSATEKNPENHRALLGLLQTGYPLKRYSEMERMLTAYLDLHPASLDMLYSFAGLLFAQGKVNEAKLEIEKILIFEPTHENALELQGIIRESGCTESTPF